MDRFLSTYNDDDGNEEEWAVSVAFGSNHGLVEDEIGPNGYCVCRLACNEGFPFARASESGLLAAGFVHGFIILALKVCCIGKIRF